MKIPLYQSLADTRMAAAATVSKIICQSIAKTWSSAISRAEAIRMRVPNRITKELNNRKVEIEVRLREAILLGSILSGIN